MKCHELRELISACVDDELHQAQREFIEQHLAGCEECRRLRDEYLSIKSSMQRLPEVPVPEGLSGIVMNRINKQPHRRGNRLSWLRPLVFAGITVLMTVILLGVPHLVPDTPEAKAAAIIKNSPEIQAVLLGEHMVDVEVTTEVVDEEGKVLMRMIRTETRAFAVEVDLENRKITEIIEVALPEFTEEHDRKARELALADPDVQQLLARGGKITGVNPGYAFKSTPAGGVEGKQPQILPYLTAFVSIQADGERWQARVLLDGDTRVPAVMLMPTSDTNFIAMNNILIGFAGPVMLLMAVFLLYDVLIRKRPTGRIVAGAALVYAALGLYLGLLSWHPAAFPQVIIFGLSLSGIIMGIIVLRTHGVWKSAAIVGTIFGAAGFISASVQSLILSECGIWEIAAVIVMLVILLAFASWGKKPRLFTG